MLTLGRREGQQIVCSHSNGETLRITHRGVEGVLDPLSLRDSRRITLTFSADTFCFAAQLALHNKVSVVLPRSDCTLIFQVDRITVGGFDRIAIQAPTEVKITRPEMAPKEAA